MLDYTPYMNIEKHLLPSQYWFIFETNVETSMSFLCNDSI